MPALVYQFGDIRRRLEEIHGVSIRSCSGPDPGPKTKTLLDEHLTGFCVHFERGKSTVLGQQDVLDRAAMAAIAAMVADPDGSLRVSLHGHTDGDSDDRGSREGNEQLGAERGLVVRHALMARGVPGDRIEVTSHGAACPHPAEAELCSGLNTVDCLNSRVEIRLKTATLELT